jgi:DNA polymerase-3 subunit beta
MKFIVQRENLLASLKQINSLIVSRPILPILTHVLLESKKDNVLLITGTDLEIEISSRVDLIGSQVSGKVTVPCRKLFDICRNLPLQSQVTVTSREKKLSIESESCSFLLSTLPVSEFPNSENYWQAEVTFDLAQAKIKRLITLAQSSMANQDARHYLNGMLFEIGERKLSVVATNGHRLAIVSTKIEGLLAGKSVIVPRRGVIELCRLLQDNALPFRLEIGSNSIRATVNNCTFTSKLVEGIFPDYRLAIPINPKEILEANRDLLVSAFSRSAILSNEKIGGVRLHLTRNCLKITTNNKDQETAEENVNITYSGAIFEISLNVAYVLDILHTLASKKVRLSLTDSMSSVKIEDPDHSEAVYIIMPMRL